VQFTDTDEWWVGSKSKEGGFRQPPAAMEATISAAYGGRPTLVVEFDNPADDPRTGPLVQEPEEEPVPTPEPALTDAEIVRLRALL
jgi:hypothetical protein|tara:strand:+ start:2768 stop:3025 length:258 start_codon:yes stop_codon:yes gene_type:complete